MKTAFLCFFPIFPTNMGSAEVIRSLFLCWPGERKIFQISHLNNKDNYRCKSVKIFNEKPILKIFVIPIIIFKIMKYLSDNKNKFIVIEGPSWIGYSLMSLILIKLFSPSTKVIYHSHSIEYEVRKMMSNRLVAHISKAFEKFVFKYSDLSTCVSNIEKRKIKSLYNVKCINLSNGVSKKILKFKKKKILLTDYIIYSGSYKYLPNKIAIDYIINNLMPRIIKKYPNIKLVITGGGFKEKKKFLINLGIVSKPKLLNLIYNSKMMVLPISIGTGTRIKIIEGLLIGAKILTTKKGIEGISVKKNSEKFPIIVKKPLFYRFIINNLKAKHNKNYLKEYNMKYSMEEIVKKFFKNKYVQNIFKTI